MFYCLYWNSILDLHFIFLTKFYFTFLQVLQFVIVKLQCVAVSLMAFSIDSKDQNN